MSDMKTKTAAKNSAKARTQASVRSKFTVRDMNREPQALLTAVKKFGQVTIRSRSSGNFIFKPEDPTPNERVQQAEAFIQRQRAYREKLRAKGFVPPSKEDSEHISRMIARDDP